MSVGIYKITNLINNKCYIGQSCQIEERFKQHIYNAKRHSSMIISQAINKYGSENFSFEIIEICPIEKLDEREIYWISYYNSTDRKQGYNFLSGGSNGHLYPPENFYKLWDEGLTVSEISEILQVSRQTVRKKLIGYNDFSTDESYRRRDLFLKEKNNNNYNSKQVYQYSLQGDFLTEYPSLAEAARCLKVKNKESIGWAASGKRQTAYGYQWKYFKKEKIQPVPKSHGVLIQCIETGKIYTSSTEAAKDVGLKSSTSILNCCAGKQKTAGQLNGQRLTWKYYK